jgi:hypothetical protein
MPYIKKNIREQIENQDILKILIGRIDTEGDLNYTITRLCHEFIAKKKESYATYNTTIGVLECAKQELYRKKISIYEDLKIQENGEV